MTGSKSCATCASRYCPGISEGEADRVCHDWCENARQARNGFKLGDKVLYDGTAKGTIVELKKETALVLGTLCSHERPYSDIKHME